MTIQLRFVAAAFALLAGSTPGLPGAGPPPRQNTILNDTTLTFGVNGRV